MSVSVIQHDTIDFCFYSQGKVSNLHSMVEIGTIQSIDSCFVLKEK